MSIWRRIFHRYWRSLGWSSNVYRTAHATWSLCPSNVHRPIIRWGRPEQWGHWWWVIEWGDGASDPVWSIGYQGADPGRADD